MDGTKPHSHRIVLCTKCRHRKALCQPGLELIIRLRDALEQAGRAAGEAFEISGMASMSGCAQGCTLTWHCTAQRTSVFCDIDDTDEIDGLLAYACQLRTPAEGGTSPSVVPFRQPAAIIVSERHPGRLQ